MEPVGVYKTLLNQHVYRFITPFITLFQTNKKTLVGASVFESDRYTIIYLYYTTF